MFTRFKPLLMVAILFCAVACSDGRPSKEQTEEIFKSYLQNNLPVSWAGSIMGGKLHDLEIVEVKNIGKSMKKSNGGKMPEVYAGTYKDCWPVEIHAKGIALANMLFKTEKHKFNQIGNFMLCSTYNDKWGIEGDSFQNNPVIENSPESASSKTDKKLYKDDIYTNLKNKKIKITSIENNQESINEFKKYYNNMHSELILKKYEKFLEGSIWPQLTGYATNFKSKNDFIDNCNEYWKNKNWQNPNFYVTTDRFSQISQNDEAVIRVDYLNDDLSFEYVKIDGYYNLSGIYTNLSGGD